MKDETSITIDFPLEPGTRRDNYQDRMAFWQAEETVNWFEKRGYTLYKFFVEFGELTDSTVPRLPISENGIGEYPFGAYDGKTKANEKYNFEPLRTEYTYGKVAFAQDSQNRHVAIKLIRADTDEHRILEFLRQQPLEVLKENCVIPVLDILPIEGFCFAVMPRWGRSVYHPLHRTVGEVLHMMHAMLKGLNFLHQNNIVHGDINANNFLTNTFGDYMDGKNQFRLYRRTQEPPLYAIMDFDYSMRLPEGTDRTKYWIGNQPAWGSFNVTMDIAQGEFDYNPFITDVGALGVMFSSLYQHLTPALPLLAPLLDRLTTRRLTERCTTSEALLLIEELSSELTEADLQKPTWEKPAKDYLLFYYQYDRWKSVPSELAAKWAHHREPPLTWTTKILRKACRYRLVARNVSRIRRIIAELSNIWRTTKFLSILLVNKTGE